MLLENTNACKLRDELTKARFEKRITLKEITDRLCKLDIPKWLQSEILQMSQYNYLNRCTDPIEQAMEKAVNYKILEDILKEEKLTY